MAKAHKITAADRKEISTFYRAGVATVNEATRAFTRGDMAQIEAWRKQVAEEREAFRAKMAAESAAFEARRATWKKFEPVTHKCADCGADVVQTDSELPPWVMYGPGWLCAGCKAKHDAEALRRSHEAGRRAAERLARWEARDAWERGEN